MSIGRRERNGVKILYIEDNPENRMLVRALLEAEGYTLVDAEEGLAGIEAALREQPALILLDMNLPGVDGYEVGVILKSFPSLKQVPIVAVTAYAMEGDRQRTLVAGCDGYIAKPIDADAFPRQVADFLRGKREWVEEQEAPAYLRELNQRLVYRLVNQVEELKRLNQHFVRRAVQLEDLHGVVQDITSELRVTALLERLLPALLKALGAQSLIVELSDPAGVRVSATGPTPEARAPGVLPGAADESTEVELSLPLAVRGRPLGVMTVKHIVPAGARSDEEQLLKIVANQVAIAVENSRLYEGTVRRAAEAQSMVEAGRLLASTLDLGEVLHRLAELVRHRLETECVVRIWLRDTEQGEFRLHAQAGATLETPPERVRVSAGEGLIGSIIYHRTSVVVNDLRTDERVRNRGRVRDEGLVSFLGVPLMLEDQPVGILTVATREPRVFAPDEVRLVEALANSASVAIWNARLWEQTQQRLSETQTLLVVSQAAGSILDVTEIGRRTIREMVRALGAEMGGVWRRNEGGRDFVPVAGYHVPPDLKAFFATTPMAMDQGAMREAADFTRAVFASDSQADPRFDHPLFRVLPHKSVLAVPMVVKGEVIGGFAVAWTRSHHDFLSEELRLVEGIARQAGIAIENARLLEAEREARERLAVSETRYRELFENVIDVVYLHDLQGRILEINEAGVRVSGYTHDELLSMNISEFVAPADRDKATAIVRRMLAGERPESFTADFIGKSGEHVILEVVGRPVLKDGVPVAVLGSARDITVRRRLERRQEALVALSRELATEIDLDRLLPRIAEEARRLTGMDAALVLLLDGEDLIFRAAAGIEASLGAIEKLSAVQQLSAGVMRTRRPAVHANLTSNARWRDTSLVQQFGYQAMLAIPITLKEDTLGVLALLQRDARAFPDEELEFLNAVATHAALAIDNARLFQQTQARLRETETLLTVSQAVSATLDPTETMRRVAREITRTLDADMVGAYLADTGRNVLRPIAGYHVPPNLYESFVEHPIPIVGHPGMEEAWRDGRPLTSDDVANDPRIDRATVERFPHQSLLFVPMIVKGAPIGGFFAVWWRERRKFTPDEMRLVSGISEQAAVLMENARLYSEATRRQREAEELARLARMLTESLDAADVGKRIVESSLGLLGGAFSVLRLLQADGSLKLISSQGEPEALATVPPIIAPGVGVVGRAAREGIPVWSADVYNDSSLTYSDDLRAFIGTRRVRGYLAVPLRVKREIIGVIGIGDFKTRVFSENEVTLLQTFADQAAIALENSRLYGDLRAALRAVEESQQRVVQGERLRALGEMAGGVAHDFNNVLAIVVGRAEVLLNETEDAELQRQLNVIIKVALDAAQTVKRIQEFTRMRRARPFQPVDLATIISEVVEVTRSRWKDDAQARGLQYEVVAELRPTPIVAGDPAELREALTNIVFNALDAMPEGGRVTLSTDVEGTHVLCRVSDTGIGMAEDVRQRIFDPFFTTKGERGTGLGLSVVYGIVTRHNAELDVQSQLGQGTTFIIKFPPPGETVVEPVARPVGKSSRKGRILVIDDEREVGDVLKDALTRDGHQVVYCTDGESGIACVEKEAFDLVITDLGMPGISGWEVARIVKQVRPGTPVAMVTGWGDRIDPVDAEGRGVDYVVAK
ncbi:MAG: hypothetical protein DMD89_38780, partial [Candidatus Rokuibacteriota bacterium]